MLEENLTQKARCKWWAHVVNALHAKTRARVEGKNWNPLAASNISNVQKVIMQKALLDTMDSCSGWPLVRYIHDVPCLGDLAQAKKSDNQSTRNIQSNQKKPRLRGHHIQIRPTRTERMSGAHPSTRLPGSRAFLGKQACSSMGLLTAYVTCWHLHPWWKSLQTSMNL